MKYNNYYNNKYKAYLSCVHLTNQRINAQLLRRPLFIKLLVRVFTINWNSFEFENTSYSSKINCYNVLMNWQT